MVLLLLLLTHLFPGLAYGMVDLGPARLSVDVFMTMDSTKGTPSSSTEAIASISAAQTTAQTPSLTTSPWHLSSGGSSYIASARDYLKGALQGSDLANPAVADTTTAVTNTAPTFTPPIPLLAGASSYLASAWDGVQGALDDPRLSSSDGSQPPFGFSTAIDWSAGSDVESSSRASRPCQSPTSFTNTRHCSKTASHTSLLSAPTAGPASGGLTMGFHPASNGTGTWTWPSIVSASPTASGPSDGSAPSTSPVVANNSAKERSRLEYWAWWTFGAFVLVVNT